MLLIGSTLLGSWFAMQAVHELGHVVGAWLTGGRVAQVVLWPTTISRTDLAENPRPLLVAWAGPVAGVILPLLAWAIAVAARLPGRFLLRFFAGFCLVANGLYLGFGSWGHVGDGGDLLRHGAAMWQLWLFGVAASVAGFGLWFGQGAHFGLGASPRPIAPGTALGAFAACLAFLVLALVVGGR